MTNLPFIKATGRFLAAISASLALLWPAMTSAQLTTEEMREVVLASSGNFSFTLFDLYMYLDPEVDPATGELSWGVEPRVREGLEQLYALKVLRAEAEQSEQISRAEQEWIADHELSMIMVKRYLAARVEEEAARIDFESLALEHYLANKKLYTVPESLDLRTLFLKTDCDSPESVVGRAAQMMVGVDSEEAFAELIERSTEDPAAKQTGGILKVTKGQTVPAFEAAAFSLKKPGDFSEPIVSVLGVHVILLLGRTEATPLPFQSVKADIIKSLEAEERNKILNTLRMEAREYRPQDLELNEDAIRGLMETVSAASE